MTEQQVTSLVSQFTISIMDLVRDQVRAAVENQLATRLPHLTSDQIHNMVTTYAQSLQKGKPKSTAKVQKMKAGDFRCCFRDGNRHRCKKDATGDDGFCDRHFGQCY